MRTTLHRSATDMSLRAVGLEPTTYGLKGRCPQTVSADGTTTYGDSEKRLGVPLGASQPQTAQEAAPAVPAGRQADPDLAAVVEAWPTLPEPVKAGILAMVKASTGT